MSKAFYFNFELISFPPFHTPSPCHQLLTPQHTTDHPHPITPPPTTHPTNPGYRHKWQMVDILWHGPFIQGHLSLSTIHFSICIFSLTYLYLYLPICLHTHTNLSFLIYLYIYLHLHLSAYIFVFHSNHHQHLHSVMAFRTLGGEGGHSKVISARSLQPQAKVLYLQLVFFGLICCLFNFIHFS